MNVLVIDVARLTDVIGVWNICVSSSMVTFMKVISYRTRLSYLTDVLNRRVMPRVVDI